MVNNSMMESRSMVQEPLTVPIVSFLGNLVNLNCEWSIELHVIPFIQQIQHKVINATNPDEYLDYENYPNGKAVVYGGFALGRALTLEDWLLLFRSKTRGSRCGHAVAEVVW